MIGTSCNEKNCPGALSVMLIGLVMFVTVMFGFVTDAQAGEVVVTFNRELPDKSVEFTRTFTDKDDFEMWLANRLEGPGCDPYLTDMKIQFKQNEEI
jgi:hypothetical protein